MLAHALYVPAAIASITAILLLGYAATGAAWFKNVFRAWDFLGAAILGGDGRHTISAYCGALNTFPHRVGRVVIDSLFGVGHCFHAAKKEGLMA